MVIRIERAAGGSGGPSAPALDIGWAGGAISKVTSGFYYNPTIGNAGVGPLSIAVGEAKFAPFSIRTPSAVSFNAICTQITTVGASSFLRFGIWENNASNRPGTLIIDAGQIDASFGTTKELAMSSTPLDPGDYWVGVAAQGTNPVAIRHYNTSSPKVNFGGATLAEGVGSFATIGTTGITGAFASDPAGCVATIQCPVIALKAT